MHSGTMLQQCDVPPQSQLLEASQQSPQLQHLGIQAVPNHRVYLSPHDIPQGNVVGSQQLPGGLHNPQQTVINSPIVIVI